MLVFAATPQDGSESRTGPGVLVEPERLPEDMDGVGIRSGVDVGVRRNVETEPGVPAPPRPDRPQEAVDVGGHRGGRAGGQHALEMLPRQAVLAFEEERTGQFQAHAHEPGTVEQDGAQRRDRLVQQDGFPLLPGRPLGRPDRRQTDEEPDVGPVRMIGRQRTQNGQCLVETPALDQRPGIPDPGVRREMGICESGRKRNLEQKDDGKGANRSDRGHVGETAFILDRRKGEEGGLGAAFLCPTPVRPRRSTAHPPPCSRHKLPRGHLHRRSPHRRFRRR